MVPPAKEEKEDLKRKEVEFYEEDDEFEEFVDEDWDESKEDPMDQKLWQDDWDDEDVDDDFCRHLREELNKPENKEPEAK